MSADRLRAAAAHVREVAAAATPGPWRDSKVGENRYGALVSDTIPVGRPTRGGWDETDAYGGYLVGESLQNGDRAHVALWDPLVSAVVADWLEEEAGALDLVGDEPRPSALALANRILIPHEDVPF